MITNLADTEVRNEVTGGVVEQWRAHGATVETQEFAASQGLPHDIIDPLEPRQQIDVTYPLLIMWIMER